MSAGERIRQKREALGLSQQQIADVAGVARANIAHYESGVKVPSVVTGKYIAKALGCTMDELFGDDTEVAS